MVDYRPEKPDDIPAIGALVSACFPTDAEARLVALLRKAGRLSVSGVAIDAGAIVGHVALSPVTTGTGETGFGLAPVCVAESHRERGIAARLIRDALEIARADGSGWGVVLGEPEYYRRFGFRPASSCGLNDAYGGGAAFQAIELAPGALPINAGRVSYAPEFDALG